MEIVFDGPPGPEAGRFIEVEDGNGKSICAGEWLQRGENEWVLRLPDVADLQSRLAAAEAELAQLRTDPIERLREIVVALSADRPIPADAQPSVQMVLGAVSCMATALQSIARAEAAEAQVATLTQERDAAERGSVVALPVLFLEGR